MNQPYPRAVPKVGDTVVETTHLIGLARHRLGLHKALGTLIEIDESGGEYGKRYLIKSHDPEEGETWWSNAMIVVVEENVKDHSPIGAVSASNPESNSTAPIG